MARISAKEQREIEEFKQFMIEDGRLAYKVLFYIFNSIRPDKMEYCFRIDELKTITGENIDSMKLSYICYNLLKLSTSVIPDNNDKKQKGWACYNLFQAFSFKDETLTVYATEVGIDIMIDIRRKLTEQGATVESLLEKYHTENGNSVNQ